MHVYSMKLDINAHFNHIEVACIEIHIHCLKVLRSLNFRTCSASHINRECVHWFVKVQLSRREIDREKEITFCVRARIKHGTSSDYTTLAVVKFQKIYGIE